MKTKEMVAGIFTGRGLVRGRNFGHKDDPGPSIFLDGKVQRFASVGDALEAGVAAMLAGTLEPYVLSPAAEAALKGTSCQPLGEESSK